MLNSFFQKLYHKPFIFFLSKEIKNDWKILDVGCGYSSPLRLVKKGSYKVGLDFFEPYILESKKLSIHDEYVLGDARDLPFRTKSFDCALAIEVLEHLTKEDGLKMIKEMERVAKEKIILTTPNGFLATAPGPKDNPKEIHLSGWRVNELKKLGFKVRGLGGLRQLWTIREGQAVLKLRLPILSMLLAGFTEIFVYFFPSLAFRLLLVKDLKENKKESAQL